MPRLTSAGISAASSDAETNSEAATDSRGSRSDIDGPPLGDVNADTARRLSFLISSHVTFHESLSQGARPRREGSLRMLIMENDSQTAPDVGVT
jgi:hypothetical protein